MSDKRKTSDVPASQAPAPKRARWDSDGPSTTGVNGSAPAVALKGTLNIAEKAAHLKLLKARLADRLSQSKVNI